MFMVRREQIDVFTYHFFPAQVNVLVTNFLEAEMKGKINGQFLHTCHIDLDAVLFGADDDSYIKDL